MKAGLEWADAPDLWWPKYYRWLEPILFHPGRWAIIPDSPGAPSQLNDGLLNDWPFGDRGAPVWHMDGPIERLARLCEKYPRVCIGWIGDPKKEPVGCEAYFRKMEEVARLMGNRWHPLHMLRGVLVAHLFPFVSADSSSLAQNGHRYDQQDGQPDDVVLDFIFDPATGIWKPRQKEYVLYRGRNRYADRLESGHFSTRLQKKVRRNRLAAHGPRIAPSVRPALESRALQFGIL